MRFRPKSQNVDNIDVSPLPSDTIKKLDSCGA